MNVLFGVPDVKEMQWNGITLKSVPSQYYCGVGNVECWFAEDSDASRCKRICIKDHIWIRESQMPEYLAARLSRRTT